MLTILSLPLAYVAPLAPARGVVTRADAPAMVKSEALPFLDAPSKLDGSMVGDVGFDPWQLSQGIDIRWMREAELKHGRICMLAFLGFIAVDLGFRAPGAPAVSSLQAHDVCVQSGHMLALLFVIAIFESLSYNAIAEMLSGETDRQPGDYGFDPLGYVKTEQYPRYQLAEIVHCRAAMLGFAGIVTQSAMFNKGFPYF